MAGGRVQALVQGSQESGEGVSTLLVVGARRDSLGAAVAHQANGSGYHVVKGGLHEEDYGIDLVQDSISKLEGALSTIQPTHVVCTVGLNTAREPGESDPGVWYRMHYEANVIGPMRLLEAWIRLLAETDTGHTQHHYVAVSSNSAHVPRSGSAAYCSSKAALSMALRVKAREAANGGSNLFVYGYEPGLLAGTPMTQDTEQRWSGLALTRMRDARLKHGLPTASLAWMMVQNLTLGPEVNGCMFRLDADEA